MTPQIDALTQPEKDMITAAATTAGRLQLTLSVNGMRSHHLFPATDHPHVPVAMPCYMIALPDPADPTDPARQGQSLLFVPIFSIQMDPMHHPQAHAAPAPRVATTMLADQPRPFVMEQQFQPLHTDPRTWGAAAIQALQLNGFSHAGRLQQVQAVLDNISPDTRHALITIHGASEMTPQDLVAKLDATYPLARSSASARGEVKDRACTNDESWTDFVNKQLSDLINTHGSNTLSELLRGKTQAYIADWTKDAATMMSILIASARPRHRGRVRGRLDPGGHRPGDTASAPRHATRAGRHLVVVPTLRATNRDGRVPRAAGTAHTGTRRANGSHRRDESRVGTATRIRSHHDNRAQVSQ